MNLLSEIAISNRFYSPSHVVALTGFEDLRKEFETKFNNGYWTIDSYDSADLGWRERLKARASYILKSSQASKASYKTDLCIVTALESPELNAIRSLPWSWSAAQAFDDVSFYYQGEYVSNGERFSASAAAIPRMGMVAAATFALKIVVNLRPRMLVMAGICAGVRGSCDIGDVIVADPSWDWQMGKYVQDAFEMAPDQIGSPLEVTQRFTILRQDRQLMFTTAEQFQGERPTNVPNLLIGPIASGSSVLADERTAEAIKSQHRKLLGVEMELYGVYSAARDSSGPRPLTFGVKAVCDFADHLKNDKFQRYAAHMSARIVGAFAERYSHQVIRPRLSASSIR
jgi:nucleoside phosphorylase